VRRNARRNAHHKRFTTWRSSTALALKIEIASD